jgi:hypothetical protein
MMWGKSAAAWTSNKPSSRSVRRVAVAPRGCSGGFRRQRHRQPFRKPWCLAVARQCLRNGPQRLSRTGHSVLGIPAHLWWLARRGWFALRRWLSRRWGLGDDKIDRTTRPNCQTRPRIRSQHRPGLLVGLLLGNRPDPQPAVHQHALGRHLRKAGHIGYDNLVRFGHNKINRAARPHRDTRPRIRSQHRPGLLVGLLLGNRTDPEPVLRQHPSRPVLVETDHIGNGPQCRGRRRLNNGRGHHNNRRWHHNRRRYHHGSRHHNRSGHHNRMLHDNGRRLLRCWAFRNCRGLLSRRRLRG